MVEPFSVAALGALAATEGIKFLYGQAAEVLKRWRDRKAGRNEEAEAPIPETGASVLQGTLAPARVDFDALDRLHDDVEALAAAVGNYAGGLQEPDPDDRDLAETLDALRRTLEVVLQQRITFQGEDRAPSGPMVIGEAQVTKVAGDVAGVRARLIRSGRVEGTLKADEVTGKAAGVDTDTIG